MSDNKYIIDKDSLTGIADAVRDKLGTGEATTDPQTGDIVYPEDKGYYLKEGLIAKFNMGDCLIQGSSYSKGEATYLIVGSASDSTEYNVYFQKPFYSATLSFTLYGYTGRTNHLSVNGVSSESINYNATKKFTFSTPQSYLIIKSDMQSAYGSDTYIYQNLTVTLFDQNGNNIGVKTTSIKSYDFLTAPVPEKIPFSIDDIQDKITNYLTCGGILETWKLSNSQSTYLTFPSGFSAENLKDMTCLSNGYPRGLYKDSLGKPVSMIDQGISLPSSFSSIGSPLTVAKISTAHSEGRTFCIPWYWKGTKIIPDDAYFIWFIVEPNDSKIYIGSGRYANYVSNGKWTIIYT